MNPLRYRALKVIVQIAYEIASGKRGASCTKEDLEEIHIEYEKEPYRL